MHPGSFILETCFSGIISLGGNENFKTQTEKHRPETGGWSCSILGAQETKNTREN